MIASKLGSASSGALDEQFVRLDIPYLFDDDDEDRRLLLGYLEARRFLPGERIFSHRERPPALLFIVGGEVLVTRVGAPLLRPRSLLGRGHCFGLGALLERRPFREAAQATCATLTLGLSQERARLARRQLPPLMRRLESRLERCAELPERERDFLRALHRVPPLGRIAARFLSELYLDAQPWSVLAGDLVRSDDQLFAGWGAGPGIYFVIEGQLAIHRRGPEASRRTHRITDGEAFVDADTFVDEPEPVRIEAEQATRFLLVPERACAHLRERSPAFHRALRLARELH